MMVFWVYLEDAPHSDDKLILEWGYGKVIGTIRRWFKDYFVVRMANGNFEYVPISECREWEE